MDTLGLATNISITEEQKGVLNRIRRNIKRSENEYALYFVECNLPNLRKQLIDELDSTDGLNILTLNLADYPKDKGLHIDEWLSKKKKRYQDGKPKRQLDSINIIGLEQLLPTDSDEQIIKTVSELNWRRSYFQALTVPIIFWLPSYALELLATQASDFYDWYSDIYHFESNLEQKKLAVSYQLNSLRHPDSKIHAQHYQTFTEKEIQLKSLRSLLDEASTPNDQAYIRTLMADLLYSTGRLDEALIYWEEAMKIAIQIGNKVAQQTILSNISQIYQTQGNHDKALDYLMKAQSLGAINHTGAISNNISLIYIARGEYEKAIQELEKSIDLDTETDDKVALSTSYMNIGGIYCKIGKQDKALDYMNKALYISKFIDSKIGIAHALNGIASVYQDKKNKDLALRYLKEASELCEEIGNKSLLSTILYNISSIYYEKESFDIALNNLNRSLAISREIGDLESVEITLSAIDSIDKLIN